MDIIYLKNTLSTCKVSVDSNTEYITLSQEQSLVVRDINKEMQQSSNSTNTIVQFISGLKMYCECDDNLLKCLFPTKLHKIGPDNRITTVDQDSFIRILLHIRVLQDDIVDFILEELATEICKENDDITKLTLTLHAFRYLPYIKNPRKLTSKLLEVVEIATTMQQLEIMNYLPNIIPDNQYDFAAEHLSKLLEVNEDIAGPIIDCVNAFEFSVDARRRIQDYVINRLLSSKRFYKIYPILFDFLLTDCEPDNYQRVLMKLRNTLDLIIASENKANDILNLKVIIFKDIKCSLVPKNLYDGLIELINSVKVYSDHKPIDLLYLFIIHYVYKLKRKSIELFIRKRIKFNLFKVSLFEKTFDKYLIPFFVEDYMSSILEIASNLLKFNHPLSNECGKIMFKKLFLREFVNDDHRTDILYCLINLIKDPKIASVVFTIFRDLMNEPKLKEHILDLMNLLEKIEVLDLKNVRDCFEILCYLTCSEEFENQEVNSKSQLHILVRKQVLVHDKTIRSKGVIGAIVMAEYLTTVKDPELSQQQLANVDLADSSISVKQMPSGRIREAGDLLQLILANVRSFPEMLVLYYDLLSFMICKKKDFHAKFIHWLYNNTLNDFNSFIVSPESNESFTESIDGIRICSDYCINTERDNQIAINIAQFSMKPDYSKNSIRTLASLTRLLRCLEQKIHNSSLDEINAVLGCGILLPQYENIETLSFEHSKLIADCLFHCINWIRELISAFVVKDIQDDDEKRIEKESFMKKVISRLDTLIDLEQVFAKIMLNIPEHKLPIGNYDKQPGNVSKAIKKPPAKKLKSMTQISVNDSTISGLTGTSTQVKSQNTKRSSKIMELHFQFREIDFDVVQLLKYPISSEDLSTDPIHINIKQYRFILRHITHTLKTAMKGNEATLSQISNLQPIDVIKDCKNLLPSISDKAVKLIEELNTLTNQPEPDLYSDKSNDLKLTLTAFFEFCSTLLSWNGFHNEKHYSILSNIFQNFRDQSLNESITQSDANLFKSSLLFVRMLSKYSDNCLHLPATAYILESMQSLYAITPISEINKTIAQTAEKLLNRKWFNLEGTQESGKIAMLNYDVIFQAYLLNASVSTICGMVGTLGNQVEKLKAKTDSLEMLPAVDKNNFPLFYRTICTALLKQVKTECENIPNNEHLVLWKDTVYAMNGLMTILKIQDTKQNMRSYLKNVINIVKVFMTHGIPVFEKLFKSKSEEVVDILKVLQMSTRYLHFVCNHTKNIKDRSLLPFVPPYRKVVETLIYKVKEILFANGCSSSFWVGNLKNRGIHGEDIPTQNTTSSSGQSNSNEDESEEELPPENNEDGSDIEMSDSASIQI